MVTMLLQLESALPNTLLAIALCLGGLVLLIVLALHDDVEPPHLRPVDRHTSDPGEVLALQLMRGDISPDEYLDQMPAVRAGVRNA